MDRYGKLLAHHQIVAPWIYNEETFKEKVFNFEANKDWKYEGSVPCMIDFYADWCGPCKIVAPVLEELQQEYGDNLVIYKVND